MSWQHDLGVIEYLTKRLRYYKRKAIWSGNLIEVEVDKGNKIKFVVCKKWRGRFNVSQIRLATKHYEKRVKEYEDAIQKLKQQG